MNGNKGEYDNWKSILMQIAVIQDSASFKECVVGGLNVCITQLVSEINMF